MLAALAGRAKTNPAVATPNRPNNFRIDFLSSMNGEATPSPALFLRGLLIRYGASARLGRCAVERTNLGGAAVQDLLGAAKHRGVVGDRLRIELDTRRRLVLEIAVPVDAANERRAVLDPRELPYMGGDVTDCIADARMVGAIGFRPVHDQHVVQRHLAGLENDVDRSLLIDRDSNLLAAAQQVVGREGVGV